MRKGIEMGRKKMAPTYSLGLTDGGDFCSHIDKRLDLSLMFYVYVAFVFNNIRYVSYFTFGTTICHCSSNWQMSLLLCKNIWVCMDVCDA